MHKAIRINIFSNDLKVPKYITIHSYKSNAYTLVSLQLFLSDYGYEDDNVIILSTSKE